MEREHARLAGMYAAFNQRDIERALELVSEHISWPKASEGGRVDGKQAIREYWTRQWAEFDPHVEPVRFMDRNGGIVDVTVHQVVKTRNGELLSDSEVHHVYTFADGLVSRMDVEEVGNSFGRSR